MLSSIDIEGNQIKVDLSRSIDISIRIKKGKENPNFFWAPEVSFDPVVAGSFIGDTLKGGTVNFKNVQINPHGNGTHTECIGHISKNGETINQCLRQFHFLAELITVEPKKSGPDTLITSLGDWKNEHKAKALIIRTTPNTEEKITKNYSGSNPTYIHHSVIESIVDKGIEHFLVDLPSLDREEDGGKLLGHKAYWKFDDEQRTKATITEMIYVPDEIKDGLYLLNLQIASFEMDASPSKPVLYKVL